MYIDEDVAINLIIHPKFNSLLACTIRIGVSESGAYPVYNIKLPITYSELTVNLQNQI